MEILRYGQPEPGDLTLDEGHQVSTESPLFLELADGKYRYLVPNGIRSERTDLSSIHNTGEMHCLILGKVELSENGLNIKANQKLPKWVTNKEVFRRELEILAHNSRGVDFYYDE